MRSIALRASGENGLMGIYNGASARNPETDFGLMELIPRIAFLASAPLFFE